MSRPDSFSDGGEFFDRGRAVEHGTANGGGGRGHHRRRRRIDPARRGSRFQRKKNCDALLPVITKIAQPQVYGFHLDRHVESSSGARRRSMRARHDQRRHWRTGRRADDVARGRNEGGVSSSCTCRARRARCRTSALRRCRREVAEFFRQQYGRALECGIDPMAIAFDPGIGFGKTLKHNLELLARLAASCESKTGRSWSGVSRKSSLGKLIGSTEVERSARADDCVHGAVARTRRRCHSGARRESKRRGLARYGSSSGHRKMIQQILQLWLDKWRSLFEILLLSVGIYYGYLYFRGTRGAKVLTGLAIVFLTLTLISQLLNLTSSAGSSEASPSFWPSRWSSFSSRNCAAAWPSSAGIRFFP